MMPLRSQQTTALQPQRETAQVTALATSCFAGRDSFANVATVASLSSNCGATVSLHRYPSPDRPAYSPSRPITVFRPTDRKLGADIGYQCVLSMYPGIGRSQSRAAKQIKLGSRSCKRHQSFLLRLQYSVWQVALTTTQSVGSLVRQAVLPLLKYSAQIRQQLQLPVPQQASSVTTPAFAANTIRRALIGVRINSENRRRGLSLTAVF